MWSSTTSTPPKLWPQVSPRKLVVVAGHEDHACALARLAQQLLHHVVVRLRPVPLPPQLPAVDDVAHQEQRLAFDVAQEVQQGLGLAAGCAQVQVADPHRAQPQRAFGIDLVVVGGEFIASHLEPDLCRAVTTLA